MGTIKRIFASIFLAMIYKGKLNMGKVIIDNELISLNKETTDKLSRLKRGRARTICFFNNKGGVGKTTLVANLAAQLAIESQQKILVIDADPQCNLSQYVLDDAIFNSVYEKDTPKNTVYDVIHPLSLGKGYSHNIPIKSIVNFGFDVIVGHPKLGLKEDLLAQDWRDAKAGGVRGLRTTFVFAQLIEQLEKKYDFIFFDMGPSLGAINRSILLAVDYFIVPMSIDIFSLWALSNIGEALKVWKKELRYGLDMAEDPEDLSPYIRNNSLSFIGYVTQQHKEKSDSGTSRIVEAYDTIKKKIDERVKRSLSGFYKEHESLHLGDIKHLASLAPKSQTTHFPMISVKAIGSYAKMRKQARRIYSGIANNVAENIIFLENK